MREFKYQLINDPRLFEVSRDINGDDELYSIFDVRLNDSHYEYLYRNNANGEYSTTPKSLFSSLEIDQFKAAIEKELNTEA
ncbi:hypothetical protein [Daejeonella lutea]|uniref:Uncharacterized protein n=1 Tax=Daejeonella lutea TaxID=572036 RepID=A0A1T5ANL0_9SPHI|nr:hypothetical protein [Daejeonella lutea]SKB36455.1 hypothetical protein SAMN05661099_0891 [Daejeonella lutea]